jgi:hypothetical protein
MYALVYVLGFFDLRYHRLGTAHGDVASCGCPSTASSRPRSAAHAVTVLKTCEYF